MAHLAKVLFASFVGLFITLSAQAEGIDTWTKTVDMNSINEVVKIKQQKLPIDIISQDFDSLMNEKQVQLDREAIEFKDDISDELEAKTLNDEDTILDDIQL